jgi:hypothetical protein
LQLRSENSKARLGSLPLVALAAMLLADSSVADERQVRFVPALSKATPVDGNIQRLAPALEIKAEGESQPHSGFTARLSHWKDKLFLGVDVADEKVLPGDILSVELHFPGAGATPRGYSYRFGMDGRRAPDPEIGPPAFASKWIETATRKTNHGWVLEASLAAKSLPTFPANGPLLLEVCITYEHRDQVAGPAAAVSNCEAGSMRGEVLRLPDDFRRSLKIDPPSDVAALEAREHGWVGFAHLHYPIWMTADRSMTPELLRTFFLEELRNPTEARISVPPRMRLPDGRQLTVILAGRDPFAENGGCNPENELKMGIYVLQGPTARRALEAPAASCTLGRATSVVLDGEGALSVGYASGVTVNFIWSSDHFERTEIG